MGLRTGSVGQILEKHGFDSSWHSISSIFVKLCLIVFLFFFLCEIYVIFKTGSCLVKNMVFRSNLNKNREYTSEGTVLIQSSWIYVKSSMNLKLGHVRSK